MNRLPNLGALRSDGDAEARYVMKVVMCGDWAVGKTSLVRRFVENRFDHDYKPSIGVNIVVKIVDIGGKKVKLDIFDTGGQERFRPLRQRYYNGASAAVFVYDMTRAESAVSVQNRWVADVEAVIPEGFERMVIANKADLGSERAVSEYAGQQLAERIGAIYTETSALDGRNVEQAFVELAARLVKKHYPEA
jgi:small GTP-binding protein